jgi:glucose/arabinose dehydrogenase
MSIKQAKTHFFIIITFFLLLSACTLRIGGANKLPDAPAPTTIPLPSDTQQTNLSAGLQSPQNPIRLPDGFAINVFYQGLKGPRMLALGPDGVVYVAERGAGRVVRLPDLDKDGQADRIEVVSEGFSQPNSLVFHPDGSLFVSEITRVLRLSEPNPNGKFQQQQVVIDGLPAGGHNTRTLLLSPAGDTLFISIGSSCNVCKEEDPRRAAVVRYNSDGSSEQVFAHGLRNAVGMVFRPGTNEIWVTNNGRDMLGDDLPPETVYQIEMAGDYGWPRCHSGRIIDPEFGSAQSCEGVLPPAVEMQAHSAPLGLRFYDGEQFPKEYQGDLFVAFHGSWNRSVPTGYKVVRIPMKNGEAGPVQDFATGWLVDNGNWGRPVDVLVGSDGALYVSDDSAGNVYRIFYTGN